MKHLKGEKVRKIIQLKGAVTENLYDYKVKSRFRLQDQLFPADTLFINKPVSFLMRHKAVLIPGGAILCGLTVFLILILINLKKQRVINRHSQKIIDLDKEVIETKRELVATLGEVIETRSQETGNHVKRVADALSMSRCYKSAWPQGKVIDYIKRESGGLFDPNLVQIFLEHLDDIFTIRKALDDPPADTG